MKYGAELSARSVPEWWTYNLEYNDIKEIIKQATGGPLNKNNISNSNDENIASDLDSQTKVIDGEKKVFDALKEQFENIDMFVRLKATEIDKRIAKCTQLVDNLADNSVSAQTSIPISDSNSKLNSTSNLNSNKQVKSSIMTDEEVNNISRIGEKEKRILYSLGKEIDLVATDLQSLSRFIGVQRTGFHKLLKKYRKWSKSNRLDKIFLPILEGQKSFTHRDFTTEFLELTTLYDVIRKPVLSHVFPKDNIADKFVHNLEMQFDLESVTVPDTRQVVFWVHKDNIVEVEIKLLKHLVFVSRDQPINTNSYPSSPSSKYISSRNRRMSNSIQQQQQQQFLLNSRERTCNVFLDNLTKFDAVQANYEPGQVKWIDQALPLTEVDENGNDSADASKSSNLFSPEPASSHDLVAFTVPVGGLRKFATTAMSKKSAESILNRTDTPEDTQYLDNTGKLAVEWIKKRDVRSVSKVSSYRTRFTSSFSSSNDDTSVSNNRIPRIWATLDKNISMHKIQPSEKFFIIPKEQRTYSNSKDNFNTPNDSTSTDGNINKSIQNNHVQVVKCNNTQNPENVSSDTDVEFPHAVLTIRWLGQEPKSLMSEFASSHLVYRVNDFSLFVHSVAIFYASSLVRPPKWMKDLESDIRKTPDSSLLINNSHSRSHLGISNLVHEDKNKFDQLGTTGNMKMLNANLNENNDIGYPNRLRRYRSTQRLQLQRNSSNTDVSLLEGSTSSSKVGSLESDESGLHGTNKDSLGKGSKSNFRSLKRGSQSGLPAIRYWNEFDHPEELDDENNYSFITFPAGENGRLGIQGSDVWYEFQTEKFIDMSEKLRDKIFLCGKDIKKFLGKAFYVLGGKKNLHRRDGYIIVNSDDDEYNVHGNNNDYDNEEDDSDLEENNYVRDGIVNNKIGSDERGLQGRGIRGARICEYSRGESKIAKEDRVLTFIYCNCFAFASIISSVLLGILAAKPSTTGEIAFVFSGLIIAVIVDFVGMILFLRRIRMPDVIHQVCVYSCFFIVICAAFTSLGFVV